MDLEEIKTKWHLKTMNKQASLDMWNSMAQMFSEDELPTFENDRFLKLLADNQMMDSHSYLLDVGCGTGGYALALAGRCRAVTGIDLSPRMLDIASEKARERNLTNVDFRCLDWHEIDLRQAGLEKGFDLVFAHLTPAVQSADTFLKLNQASRGWCALSKPTRRIDPVSDEVKRLIGLSEKRESSDEEILYAFELLWRQGFSPRLDYEQQSWNMNKTLQDALGMYVNRVKTYRDISSLEEDKIKGYLQSILKDGLVCETVETTVTTLFWHV